MKLACAGVKRLGSVFNLDGRRLIAVANDETQAQWNMLMPIGQWHRSDFPEGGIKVDASLVAKFVANWKANGSPALPVDYHHEEGDIASGWIEQLEARADGLWGATKWTKTARAHILDDEYRYLSPTFALESTDRRSGKPQGPWLYGAALLNDPFFDSMPRVAASVDLSSTQTPKAPVAKEQHLNRKLLCARLGLGEDATDEQINAALAKPAVIEAAAKPDAAVITAAVEAAIAPLKGAFDAQAKALTASNARIDELIEQKATAEVDALVDGLLHGKWNGGKQGHIIASQADQVKAYAKALGVAEAQKFYSAMAAGPLLTEQLIAGKDSAETPVTAKAKLEAKRDELMKADGTLKASAAYLRAIEMHPELAKAIGNTDTAGGLAN